MTRILEALQWPHWMMVAGAFVLMVGLVDLALENNRRQSGPERKAKGK